MPAFYFVVHLRRCRGLTLGAVWHIEPVEDNATWYLKLLSANGDRHLLEGYSSPLAAATAVARGETGVEPWDRAEQNEADFAFEKWAKISCSRSPF